MSTPIPCQCDLPSTDHAAGRCDHAAIAVYRDGTSLRLLALCDDCHLTEHTKVRDLA